MRGCKFNPVEMNSHMSDCSTVRTTEGINLLSCEFSSSLTSVPLGFPVCEQSIMPSLMSDVGEDELSRLSDVQLGQNIGISQTISNEMHSIELGPVLNSSFLLLNESEELQVKDEADLLSKMCPSGRREKGADVKVKVVSIFGNTGEGKSHLLNQVFFHGTEVFKTSCNQISGTLGIHASYDLSTQTLILDTEGMLGVSHNEKLRLRFLLKVLAISDVILYRTRSERLHTDMYKFLGNASTAYTKYFKDDLEKVARESDQDASLGPSLYIIHDTRNTDVLYAERGFSPEEYLRKQFQQMKLSLDAYSTVHYVGEAGNFGMNFDRVRNVIGQQLADNTVRSPRRVGVILDMLKAINEKFNGLVHAKKSTFPDEYFTCTRQCKICQCRCVLCMNHSRHGESGHKSSNDCACRYVNQHDNKIYLCRACDQVGMRSVVVPKASSHQDSTWFGLAKYAWAGFILECDRCGIIYRSRQYWYGNESPEQSVVKEEYFHVWPDTNVSGSSANAGRQVLEGISALGSALSSISAPQTKMVSSWITSQVNPTYWKADHLCQKCELCNDTLDTIHHCRKCGGGFCDECSDFSMAVPERGWGDSAVRVCRKCFSMTQSTCSVDESNVDETQIKVRQVTEAISGTLANVAKYPIDLLKDSTRPSYWEPDEQIKSCCVCTSEFGPRLCLHHCRACGKGVCAKCSPEKRPVRIRGWDSPVRVCNACWKSDSAL